MLVLNSSKVSQTVVQATRYAPVCEDGWKLCWEISDSRQPWTVLKSEAMQNVQG